MLEAISDAELMARARRGDREAFDALVRRHRRSVWSFAMDLVRDPHTADDVAQETFVRVWRSLERFDETRAFWPWVQTIARHVCLDEQRARSRFERRTVALDHRAASPDFTPACDAMLDRRHALTRALGVLTPRHRTLFLGQVLEGRSQQELARADGSTSTAVGKALVRARARMRDALGSFGDALAMLPPVVWLRRWRADLGSAVPLSVAFATAVAATFATTLAVSTPQVEPGDGRGDTPTLEAVHGRALYREAVVLPAVVFGSHAREPAAAEPVWVQIRAPRDGGMMPERKMGVEIRGPDGELLLWYENESTCQREEAFLTPGGPVRFVC